jgi:16S rRNA (guanine(966)-N(2))-methyltransferase RsmD
MRIIGGQAKGRRIAVPPGYAVRPTSDRIKEALFNILGPVEGQKFLDLYAGTGNVGMEALSRGADAVVFVEKISVLVTSLKRNLEQFGFQGRYRIFRMEVEKAFAHLAEGGMCFDLIFADPPYRKGLVDRTIGLIKDYPSILRKDGMLVLQHAANETIEIKEDMAMDVVDVRRYGDTLLTFLNIQNKVERG